MAAAAILAIGILGAMQSLLAASQQNVNAMRMVRASQIAAQARAGLQQQRYSGVVGAGKIIDAANCSAAPAVLALADRLQNIVPAPCVIDLDAWELAQLPVNVIAPGFTLADATPATTTDGDLFRRVLVVSPSPAAGVNTTGIWGITVVVSFRSGLTRLFVRQTTGLYNPGTNQAGSEI